MSHLNLQPEEYAAWQAIARQLDEVLSELRHPSQPPRRVVEVIDGDDGPRLAINVSFREAEHIARSLRALVESKLDTFVHIDREQLALDV